MLWTKITDYYPELLSNDIVFKTDIILKDDGDGNQYIAKWAYSKPVFDEIKDAVRK